MGSELLAILGAAAFLVAFFAPMIPQVRDWLDQEFPEEPYNLGWDEF